MRRSSASPGPTTAVEFTSRSPEETRAIGKALAASLPIPGVVLLRGSLGAGKTTFTQGLAEGLGVADAGVVSSPSFTLVNIYNGRVAVYHADLYRLEGARELYSTGLEDFLGRDGVTVVEWSEHLGYDVESATTVTIEDSGDDERRIVIATPAANPGRRSPKGHGRAAQPRTAGRRQKK